MAFGIDSRCGEESNKHRGILKVSKVIETSGVTPGREREKKRRPDPLDSDLKRRACRKVLPQPRSTERPNPNCRLAEWRASDGHWLVYRRWRILEPVESS